MLQHRYINDNQFTSITRIENTARLEPPRCAALSAADLYFTKPPSLMTWNINDSAGSRLGLYSGLQRWNIEHLPRLEIITKERRIATEKMRPIVLLQATERQQAQHLVLTKQSDNFIQVEYLYVL